MIQFQLEKKSVWLYDEPKNVSYPCLLACKNYEVRSTENVRTMGDEVALNAKNSACCGGPQSKRLPVSCLYANMGNRGQVQVRLPSIE